MDVGLVVVIGAVLVFYLRLILMQRERVKRVAKAANLVGKKSPKNKPDDKKASGQYSIISRKRSDLAIAGVGLLAVLAGVALNAGWIDSAVLQGYWWLPTAIGIVAFSWAFSL